MSSALAVAAQPLSFLAFDFGVRRVGVATGNSLTRTATPLTTIAAEGDVAVAPDGEDGGGADLGERGHAEN